VGVIGADRGRGPAIAARPCRRGASGAVRRPDHVRGRRGAVRPTAERYGERADQPQRSESGAGPGRRAVRDNVHGRRAVVQLGAVQQRRRRVRTSAHRHRVHRVQVQLPTPPGRQKVSTFIRARTICVYDWPLHEFPISLALRLYAMYCFHRHMSVSVLSLALG